MLVEGPRWWREQAIQAGKVVLEGKEILTEPWKQARVNRYRLKSTWVKVLGLPVKHWHKAEFERLIEKFGVLLEIDRATEEKTSFEAAKIRIGVSAQSDIPATGKAFFTNDVGEWCWSPVRFVIETPGPGRTGGVKRRRTWVRKLDSDKTDSDPTEEDPKGGDPTGEEFNGEEGDDLEYEDEDPSLFGAEPQEEELTGAENPNQALVLAVPRVAMEDASPKDEAPDQGELRSAMEEVKHGKLVAAQPL